MRRQCRNEDLIPMKKTLIAISSLLVVLGVFTSSSLAHDGAGGDWHGKQHASHAKLWVAKLTAPTADVSTTARASHFGGSENAGATAPVGTALYAQNSDKWAIGVRVKNLSATTKYDVAIYKDNSALNPPAIPAFTTDANGFGATGAIGERSDFGLEKSVTYTVKVTNEAGDTVLSGPLERIRLKRHRGGCDGHHGLSNDGSESRSGHHHRHHHH
jgi:hypothetical protein